MPKIPVYLASADYRPPRGDVEAAGAGGRMLARFGEAVGEFGGKLADTIAARAKAADAEAERAAATAKAMAAVRQPPEPTDGAVNLDAVMKRYWERADGIGRDIAGSIGDNAARNQFDADFGTIAGVQATLLQRDTLRGLTDRARRELDGHLGLYADVAAGARHPVEHDDAVGLALREIQGKADAGLITAEDAGRIEQAFHGDLAGRQAKRAIAADPQSALDSLEGGEEFAALDADARARLTAEAERAVQAQAVRAQTEQAALRRDTQVRISDYLEALRDGDAPDDARFGRAALTATLGAAEGDKRWAAIEEAQRFGQIMARVKWATPDEISDLVDYGDRSFVREKLPFVVGSLDGARKEPLIELAVDRRNRQLWAKPADYVLANPRVAELHAAMVQATARPALPPTISAALQSGGNSLATVAPSADDRRATIAAYANATLAEQERLGVSEVDRQVLPTAMAQVFVMSILGSDPAKADQTLRDLAADWGADWPRARADLRCQGLPGEYALLAGFEDPVARQGFAKVLAAQASEPDVLRAKAGADADVIDGLLPDTLPPLLDRITEVNGTGSEGQALSDDVTRAVRLLAYHHAPFTEPREAVRRAVAEIGDNTLFRQRTDTASESSQSDRVNTTGWSGQPGDDELAGMLRDMGVFLPPERTLALEQSEGKSWRERILPPVSPEDVAQRKEALRQTQSKLSAGRAPWQPPPAPNPEPVFTESGERLRLIDGEGNEVPAVIPQGWDLRYFAFMGERLHAMDETGKPQAYMSLSAVLPLLLFPHGLPWDLQRIDAPRGKINELFRPISSAAIGVYAAAAGIPFEVVMTAQKEYAKILSTFDRKEKATSSYAPLPDSNVENTKRGYDAYKNGQITAADRKR